MVLTKVKVAAGIFVFLFTMTMRGVIPLAPGPELPQDTVVVTVFYQLFYDLQSVAPGTEHTNNPNAVPHLPSTGE
jgi:hypothetical protein